MQTIDNVEDYVAGFRHGLSEGTRALLCVMVGKPYTYGGRYRVSPVTFDGLPPLDPSLVAPEVRDWALDVLANLEERPIG